MASNAGSTVLFFALFVGSACAHALGGSSGPLERGPLNVPAIAMFLVFVAVTLGITWWAARRTRTAADYYAAGGSISGTQNGFAIAGDFMSAASFLGVSGLIYSGGFDGLIWGIGGLAGWPLLLFLIAERLRNLGRYTFGDAVSFRLAAAPMRTLSACSTLVVISMYLIGQMVGAGTLIQVLFGLPYSGAVLTVGALMIFYVTFGGMIATTWVQITKAVLLLFGSTVLAVLVMAQFDFSFERMFRTAVAAHNKGIDIMAPGGIVSDPVSVLSLGTALVFGTAGLPHILMRFFTVRDARAARHSVFVASGLIGYFYLLIVILGFGAIALLARDPQFLTPAGGLRGGDNMAAIHLSHVVAGDLFLGFISAVAFATILAVVSGLTLSGASAIAHDIYANVIRAGRATEAEVIGVSRLAAIALGVLAVTLGIAFEGQNVAYMVLLSFAVAASVNFPILFMSLYWRRLTTRGAVAGGSFGLITACACVVFGPTVWVDTLHHAAPLFPYRYPALFPLLACVSVTVLVSLTDRSARAAAEATAFDRQYVRSVTGVGASGASDH